VVHEIKSKIVFYSYAYMAIAARLGITYSTVSAHIISIRRKFGGNSSFQAVAIAVSLDVVDIKT